MYVYRAMCMNVCMYHRLETSQYVNKLFNNIGMVLDTNW